MDARLRWRPHSGGGPMFRRTSSRPRRAPVPLLAAALPDGRQLRRPAATAVGVIELICVVLLLVPRTAAPGALLSLLVIGGAIFTHLTSLGIAVPEAPGSTAGRRGTVRPGAAGGVGVAAGAGASAAASAFAGR